MRIRFITQHPGHQAKAGDVKNIPDETARELIARRYAVPEKEQTEKAVINPSDVAENTTATSSTTRKKN